MESMTELRGELTDQLAQARAVNDHGSANRLVDRIRSLDARSGTLEQRLLQVDDAIATAMARGVPMSSSEGVTVTVPQIRVPRPAVFPRPGVGEPLFFGTIAGMMLMFAILGVLLYRWGWGRAKKKFAAAGSADPAQIQNLQQAVDVIAVEVERIAEGQRFVSKLLNERMEGAGAAERERVLVPKGNAERG